MIGDRHKCLTAPIFGHVLNKELCAHFQMNFNPNLSSFELFLNKLNALLPLTIFTVEPV